MSCKVQKWRHRQLRHVLFSTTLSLNHRPAEEKKERGKIKTMRIAHPSRAPVPGNLSLLASPCMSVALTRLLARPSILRRRPDAPVSRLRPCSMATAKALSPAVTSAEEDEKFGFRRADMYKSSLSNTVDAYDRHVLVCFKGPEAWAPRAEDSDSAVLPKLLFSSVKARKKDIALKTKLTVCGGCDGIGISDGDVLIFPDMIKYKGLRELDVDGFVDDVFVNGRHWASGVSKVLTGSHIFVCSHGSRDRRCGLCGPALIEKLNEEIELRGLKDQVFVSPCSHTGGHKYAGNLIIYSPDQEGKTTGHWYGYVTPDDVPDLLDQHVAKGLVIERLWRGQMGTSLRKGERAEKQNLPDGKDVEESEKPRATSTETLQEDSFTCCQGPNGLSCCTDQDSSRNNEEKPNETVGKAKGPL